MRALRAARVCRDVYEHCAEPRWPARVLKCSQRVGGSCPEMVRGSSAEGGEQKAGVPVTGRARTAADDSLWGRLRIKDGRKCETCEEDEWGIGTERA